MAERRTAEERGQWKTPTDASAGAGGGVGAPGSTGAYKTTDPLGAPGSTGAGQTNLDPTAILAPAAAVDEDPAFDYGGGQQQQHRHPTSGQQEFGDPQSGIGYGGGGQQQQHRHPTSGHQELGDPLSGIGYGGGQQHQHLNPTSGIGYGGGDPTSGIGYGDRSQQQELRDPSGVGITDTGKFQHSEGDQAGSTGATGYTRVANATTPVEGGGVVYGRETATTTAEDLGAAGAGTGWEEKGVVEKPKDKIKGAVRGHHSR